MNELKVILEAFEEVKRLGQSAALATVVKVSGSAYRRPGARMLVTASGQTVGMISGGCLENDVFAHAQQVMQTGKSRVVNYDTTVDEDVVWGLGLGCNGIVQILIESLEAEDAFNSLTLLAQCFNQQRQQTLATVFKVEGSVNVNIGAHLLSHPDGTVMSNIADPSLALEILSDVQAMPYRPASAARQYEGTSGNVEVLIEQIHPPTSLVIFGAGQDAVPVAQLAKMLGWQVTIVDCRANAISPARFPMADAVVLSRRNIVHKQVSINADAVAIVMTHHYLDDAALLKMLLPSPACYIGVLGPKHRTERLLQSIQPEICINQAWDRLYTPIGLDVGAETPEAIAVSIVAEIQAVLTNRFGGSLRNRKGTIHTPIELSQGEEPRCLQSVL